MSNGALDANPGNIPIINQVPEKPVDIALTVRGSDWYWTVTAIMTVATIVFVGWSYTIPRTKRVFHYITAAITLVAAIAYFTMASNLGWTPINVEFQRLGDMKVSGYTREIFYVRYIDWFITTPLLLSDLLLTAGLPWPTILYTILLNEVMIVTGLVGALVQSSYKWGYFVFGCLAFLAVAWNVTWTARKHANALGPDVSRIYLITGVWTIGLWFLYPIAWGLCEGGNVISGDSEAIFYGILDVLAKPAFGAILLFGHRNIDPARLGLHIRDYDDDPASVAGTHSSHHGEKGAPRNGAPTTEAV
ncbi:MAG: ion channel activity [Sclerophora amabilis]|nr:MAG: ion channel activity [Sclerophora amabilis]